MLYKADFFNWFGVSFFVIRRKLGPVLVLLAKSLKFLCSNLNLPVSVGCILLCQLCECKSHEACSILSKCLKFMFYYYYFLELTFVRLLLLSVFQRLKLRETHPGHDHQWRTFTHDAPVSREY